MTIDWQMKRRKLDELLTVDSLTAWLETQVEQHDNGELDYIWQDPVYCLMGRYLHDHGMAWGDATYSEMPSYDEIAGSKPWTLGAALERAKELRARALKALPPPHLELEAQRIEAEPVPAEVFHELAPDDVRLLAPERHPAGDDGAAAQSREELR